MLLRKMFRDIGKHKIQFVSIFLMVFLGSFVYSGVGGEWNGIKEISTDYYEETNLADIIVYGNRISEQDVEELSSIDGVKDVERRLVIEAASSLSHHPKLELNFIDTNDISKAHIVDGNLFDTDSDGVWVDSQFMKANHLSVGDAIEFSVQGRSLSYTVEGTIMSPDYVYFAGSNDLVPNHKNTGFIYLPYCLLPSQYQGAYSEVLLTTKTTDYDHIEKTIESELSGRYSALVTRDNMVSYQNLSEEIKQHQAMGSIFPIAFLMIAILSVLTTMIRLLSSQRLQISTLKALGFGRRKILIHYLSYGFIISLVAALVGALLGPITLPYLFYPVMSESYTLPQWSPVFSLSFLILPIILVLCCTCITYLVCRGYIKETPAQGMRQKTTKKMKQSRFEKTKLWQHLKFNSQWNIRDILRNKMRSLMVVIGIAGCSGLLVCALGMSDSINNIIDWQYGHINRYQTQLILEDNIDFEQLSDIKETFNGEEVMDGAVEIKANDLRKSGSLQVVEDDSKLIQFLEQSKKPFKLSNNGVALSNKMAKLLNVKVGDKIAWHVYGEEEWYEAKVTQLYYTPTNQGMSLKKSNFESSGHTFKATQILTKEAHVDKQDGVASVWDRAELKKGMDSMLEMVSLLIYILILAAVLMAVVVLYSLGIISFSEKYKDLATLKVLGFKSKRIQYLLIQQNMMLTLIGIPLGFGFGYFLINSIMEVMGDTIDLLVYIDWKTFVLCAVGTFVLSTIISIIFSRRVKKIDMVSALKGDE